MDPAQYLERARIETLRAQRNAIDSGLGVAQKTTALYRPWIRLQGDFSVVRNGDARHERADQVRKLRRSEQTWGAAAEKNRVDPASLETRQFHLEIPNQRIDVR